MQRACSTQISFFATSRSLPRIEKRFAQCISKPVRATDEDIRRYIDSQMHRTRDFVQRDEDLKEEIKRKIVTAVEGVFLLARFHSDFISESTTVRAIREGLNRIPQGSDGYDYASNEAMVRIKTQVRDPQQMAIKALSWITFSGSHLSVEELQHALATRAGDTDFNHESIPDASDIISVCAGLVAIDEESNIIRLVHYTLQEYLIRTEADWFPDSQARITEICISYLSFSSFQHARLTDDCDLEERLQKFKLYEYCSLYWGDHARAASNLHPEIMQFLRSGRENLAETGKVISIHDTLTLPANQVTALHMAAYFGMAEAADELLKDGYQADICNALESVSNHESKPESLICRTPLQLAAGNGHVEVTRLLLDWGADIESMHEANFDRSPLLWASSRGHESVVKLLLDRGANIESRERTPNNTLDSTIHTEDQTMAIQSIDRGTKIQSRGEDTGVRPLLSAVMSSDEAMVKLLLAHGANIESKEKLEGSPLSWASWKGDQRIVQLLLAKGADIESKTAAGDSPLSMASLGGHHAVAKLLLEHGADIESRDLRGTSPLYNAVARCDKNSGAARTVQILIDYGAQVDSLKDDGITPLLRASFLGDVSIVEQLLDHGADTEATGHNHTSLTIASKKGHLEVAKVLLKGGAQIEAKYDVDGKSQTSLSLASELGLDEVVKLLLLWNADTETRNNHNQTPLMLASKCGSEKAIQHLLHYGADISAKDDGGWTAVTWALFKGDGHGHDTVRLLLDQGADDADNS